MYSFIITGLTEIHHNSEDPIDIQSCSAIGCFKHMINYGSASSAQMKALIDQSETCKQYIQVSKYFFFFFG